MSVRTFVNFGPTGVFRTAIGLTNDLVQDLLDDDSLDRDQDVLHKLSVGRRCLKNFYSPILVFVVSQEFLFQKLAKIR